MSKPDTAPEAQVIVTYLVTTCVYQPDSTGMNQLRDDVLKAGFQGIAPKAQFNRTHPENGGPKRFGLLEWIRAPREANSPVVSAGTWIIVWK